MNVHDASYYMTTHEGEAPMVGFFVQRLTAPNVWVNIAATWPSREQAQNQIDAYFSQSSTPTRICKVVHEPLP